MGDQCVQVSSALSPQVFQARENNEMHSVALNLGSYNAQKYFCNRSTVIDFENLIKNIYAHLSLQNDCAKDN
jgi:hypothetical protein